MALAQPPPHGVTGLQVAGRQYVSKRWVWMRLHANTSAMKTLASLGTWMTKRGELQFSAQQWTADDQYNFEDQQRVNWPGDAVLEKLPAFEFWTGDTGTWLWHGIMLKDRQSHTVFIMAYGD
jgi:hypothetical protein